MMAQEGPEKKHLWPILGHSWHLPEGTDKNSVTTASTLADTQKRYLPNKGQTCWQLT